jgi:ATP synthase protein I
VNSLTGDLNQMGSNGKTPDPHDAELKARLDKLSAAISSEMAEVADEKKAKAGSSSAQGIGTAMGTGFRVASELFAGILVGGFIGWWIDRWFNIAPVGLLVMLLVGAVAGFWNVYKLAAKTGGSSSGPTNI